MGELARKKDAEKEPEPRTTPWPLCDESQADGVPCEELERNCDECEEASAERSRGDAPERPDDEGPLPVSGA